jgi:hypothetical protein
LWDVSSSQQRDKQEIESALWKNLEKMAELKTREAKQKIKINRG